MSKPDRKEVAIIIAPVFVAEAVVVVALFMGGAIVVQGHTLWAVIIGLMQ